MIFMRCHGYLNKLTNGRSFIGPHDYVGSKRFAYETLEATYDSKTVEASNSFLQDMWYGIVGSCNVMYEMYCVVIFNYDLRVIVRHEWLELLWLSLFKFDLEVKFVAFILLAMS